MKSSDNSVSQRLVLPCEAADHLRRSVKSLYELVKQRKLIAVRDGPRLLKFRVEDLNAYIESNLIRPSTDPLALRHKSESSIKHKSEAAPVQKLERVL